MKHLALFLFIIFSSAALAQSITLPNRSKPNNPSPPSNESTEAVNTVKEALDSKEARDMLDSIEHYFNVVQDFLSEQLKKAKESN